MTRFARIAAIVVAVVAIIAVLPVSASAQGDPTNPSDNISLESPPVSEPPLPAEKPHTPIQYTVQDYPVKDPDLGWGRATEDAAMVASRNGLTTDEIKYSNPDKDVAKLAAGDILILPPLHGVVYKIKGGDTLGWVAYSFQADLKKTISYNNIQNPNVISPGQVIIVPDAKFPPIPRPAPVPVASSTVGYSSGGTYSPPSTPAPYSGGNHFSYGYCTYWVASKRSIPWFGDAGAWWYNARSYGYAEGQAPRAGAILVEAAGPVGHVAYVESVGAASFVVSEMNWDAWNVVDYRTIQIGAKDIVGFIY